ncbi:MAG: 2-phosphoglycerate kinase [Candidatus Hermodarchaeota archaeon]
MSNTEIRIRGTRYSMPFSNGILASSLLRAGMSTFDSFKFAENIRKYLLETGRIDITEDELSEIIIQELENQNYQTETDNYRIWQRIRKEKLGIVILIGGVTGIGKSTVAKEVSYRLGFTSSIGTDSIRQVMRKTISGELTPELHESSYLAYKHIDTHPMISDVIVGFERQCRLVSVGINGIIERSKEEGVNILIEGIHIIPGFFKRDIAVFPFILHLEDLQTHTERIYSRSRGTRRPVENYFDHLDNIITIQKYIKSQAKEYDVPIIENTNFEQSINIIIKHIVDYFRKQLEEE